MCTAALFQSQGHFTGGNSKPAAFNAGSVVGCTQFIDAGEDVGYVRVSMDVRAELADGEFPVRFGISIVCSLGNVGAAARRPVVSEKWSSVEYLGALLVLEDLHS